MEVTIMRSFSKLANLHSVFFKQSEGIDPRVAEARAQRDAIRKSLDVTGPGGGTTQGHVRSDGKGGWEVSPGAQYTPQKGYNQQGYKIPDPIPGAGGQANTPPVPYGKQVPPQPVDPRLEQIRKSTAWFENLNNDFETSREKNRLPGANPQTPPAAKPNTAPARPTPPAMNSRPQPAAKPNTAPARPRPQPAAKPNTAPARPKPPAGNTYAPSRFPPR